MTRRVTVRPAPAVELNTTDVVDFLLRRSQASSAVNHHRAAQEYAKAAARLRVEDIAARVDRTA